MASKQTLQTADFQPVPLDICVARGDSPIIPFKLSLGSGGDANVSGGVFTLTVSGDEEPLDNSNQQFQVTGLVVAAGATGEFTFQPTSANNTLDPNSEWFHDIYMVHPVYGSRTLFKGRYVVSQDINKD